MINNNKKIVVIGGGIAGMESSAYLTAMGYEVVLLEKTDRLGGHLLNWEQLFPTRRLGKEVVDYLKQGIELEGVDVRYNCQIKSIEKSNNQFILRTNKFELSDIDAVLVCTGYDLFDARKKEEYGYGIYNNVITSAEFEAMFLDKKGIHTAEGKIPQRIAFVNCVGSRDIKCNLYCSKVCCVTAVKQAIEAKSILPESEIFCFYMDLRMYGTHFEELYKESQEKWGVNYIRGRLSEASENIDHSIRVKAEDTLAGKPIKMDVDLLVLMVGFVPSEGTKEIGKLLNLQFKDNGFINSIDEHTMTNITNIPGVFVAGTASAPRTISNTITDARSAVTKIVSYLNSFQVEKREQEKRANYDRLRVYHS